MNGRPVLELDDPLTPRAPAARAPDATDSSYEQPARAPKTPTRRRTRQDGPTPVASANPPDASVSREFAVVGKRSSGDPDGAWRNWAGGTRVASYRLPDELLEELDGRARRLGVPIGMTVAAGLLQLFDQDDETIVRLVERAEDARVLGRRAARRRS